MALSDKTIQNLSIALTPDVIDDIFQDERYIELMMELIPEFVSKSLKSEDVDMVVEIGICIMDNITMKPRKTLWQLAQGHWISSGDLCHTTFVTTQNHD